MQDAKDLVDRPVHEVVALAALCDQDGLGDLKLFFLSHGFTILVDPQRRRVRLEGIELGVLSRGKQAVSRSGLLH